MIPIVARRRREDRYRLDAPGTEFRRMLRQQVEDSFAVGCCQQSHVLVVVRCEASSWPVGGLRVHSLGNDSFGRCCYDIVSEDVLQISRFFTLLS